MCFATMALVAGVAGAGMTAAGTLSSGFAASNAASYQAQVARNNAQIAQQNADYAIAAGQAKASTESLKGAAIGGKIKAAQAASGVDVNTGSAVDVQMSQREQEKLDTETTLHNSQLTAYGYRTQATNFEAESKLDEMKADSAKTGAILGATGSLLGSASSLGFKWGAPGTSSPSVLPGGVGSSPY